MNKIIYSIGIGVSSSIIGFIMEYFGSIQASYMILLALITIDTLTGIVKAIKYNRFSIFGLKKFVKKIVTYSLSILVVRLLELAILPLFETTLLSNIIVSLLAITETVSILNNLSLLGVPIKSNLIKRMIGKVKIPGVGEAIENIDKTYESYIEEIDEIVKYQISSFANECVKKLLEIKFEVWRSVVKKIIIEISEHNSGNNELLYYKVMYLIESAFKEMQMDWQNANVDQECICRFSSVHKPRVDKLMEKVSDICFSNEGIHVKKLKLIESIVVILYQTIVDARRDLM
ncbi:MAG: phage holin family protein [Acetivibrionales bacterium]